MVASLAIGLQAPPRAGATALPTTISSNMTLTAAASPYTGSSTTIASGVTVTVDPGAVVKLSGSLTATGTLSVQGTGANPAVFTSSQDSAAGQWGGITLNSSLSTIDHAEIRYATTGLTTGNVVAPSITNSTIRNNSSRAISLSNPGSAAAVTGNTLSNNANGIYTAAGSPEIANNTISDCSGGYAISYYAGNNSSGQVRIHDNTVLRCGAPASQSPSPSSYAAISVYGSPFFNNTTVTGSTLGGNTVRDGGRAIDYYVDPYNSTIPANIDENTLSGNGSNAIWVSGKVDLSTTWENHGFAMVPRGGYGLEVASAATLTLGAGLVLKPYQTNGQITVEGNLLAQGTGANPITITSVKDDSVGGDTNGDGAASSPAAGDWDRITLSSTTSNPNLDHVEIRYAKQAISAGSGVSPSITNSTLRNTSIGAITLSNPRSATAITANTLSNNASGIFTAAGSPEIASNTISDCSGGYAISYYAGNNSSGQVRIHDNTVDRCGASASQSPSPSSYAAISVYGAPSYNNTTVTGSTLGGNTVRDGGRAIDYYVDPTSSTIPANVDENTLSGNGSNAIWVSGKVAASTTWESRGFAIVPRGGYNLEVASGSTLTLGAGSVIKPYQFNAQINVDGSLVAQGTAADPITFTSIKDDSIGGDTNGDGPASSPVTADWDRINLNAASGSPPLDHIAVRYGTNGVSSSGPVSVTNSIFLRNKTRGLSVAGGGAPQITGNTFSYTTNGTAISLSNPSSSAAVTGNTLSNNASGIFTAAGSPEIANNTISDCSGGYAISYYAGNNSSGQVRIHDNTVDRCGASASQSPSPSSYAAISVYGAPSYNNTTVTGSTLGGNTVRDGGRAIDYYVDPTSSTIPANVDENTLSGNGSNAIWVSGKVAASTTWESRGFAIVPRGGYNLEVASGATLTFGPGLVVKPYQNNIIFTVDGSLVAAGTAGAPITITSIKDDSAGGDTNGDGGASSPAAGDWLGFSFSPGTSAQAPGRATLDYVKARYGGAGSGCGQCSGGGPMLSFGAPATSGPTSAASSVTHSAFSFSVRDAIVVGGDYPAGNAPSIHHDLFRGLQSYAISKGGTQNLGAQFNDSGCLSGGFPKGCGASYSARVDHSPEEDQPDDAGNCPGAKRHCPHGADPVSLANGAFDYEHTDLSLTNAGGELAFKRAYYSQGTDDSGLGPGWSHTGLMTATELESGDVVVHHFDGHQDVFAKTGSTYTSAPGVTDRLTKETDGTFRLKALDRTVYEFDPTSRIKRITDDHGLATTFSYDSSGRLASIADASGQSLTFTYNASNHITKVTDSAERQVDFTYTTAGDLDTVTDALGGITDYGYDAQRRLTTIKDPRGVTFLANTYDAQGRVSEQRDALGNLWTIAYGSGQTTVTEPEGGERTYAFDGQLRVSSVTDELGHATSYSYDAAGDVDQITRPGGAVTALDYDSAGNLLSATDPEGGQRSFSYDSLNRLIGFTDERSKTWTYTWNSANDLIEIEDPDSETTDVTYNSAGQPLTVTDPNDHTTTLAYGTHGVLASVTDPLDHQTTYGYDAYDQLTSITRPGLAAETYTRSALGDLLSTTTPEGNTTSFGYDPNGALTSITDPATNQWQITRDGMERPTVYRDPLLNETTIAYDGNLNPTSVTNRNGNVTTYAYDLANQLVEVDAPATGPWQLGYDARGNRDQVTDPNGRETDYSYDLADRLVEADEPLSTSSSYDYDPAGNLASLTDPNGHTTSFDYDDRGRLAAIDQPLSKTTSFDYDRAGNLIGRSTAEDALSLAYDDADRLTSISDGTQTLRGYGYDAADRLTSATDAQSKTLAFGYDGEDNLVSVDDGRGQTASRSFDERGNLTAQSDGRGTLSYAYDELNRMTSLTDPNSDAIGFDYDPEDNLTETGLPNGVVTSNTYDDANRMASTSSANGSTVLQSFDYAYDDAGNRTSQTDRNNDATTYAYDALNRLAQFDPPGSPAVDYGYDPAGNRTSAGSTTYDYNALNQLTGDSDGRSYDYDGAGRLAGINDGTSTTGYTWDALDELAAVDDGSSPVSYSYDALGRRSERTAGATTETAHYGDLTDLATLDTGTSGVLRSWIQGPTGLAGQTDGSATQFPVTDAHGDVTTLADDTGAVSSRQEYDPWGSQLGGPALPMGWLGAYERRADGATGLMQMGVRMYVPTEARFASEDPILGAVGFGQHNDRYAYVSNSPINRYDLSGLWLGPIGDTVDEATGTVSTAVDDVWDATADARHTVGYIVDHPQEASQGAVDYWAQSDSPFANVFGPLAAADALIANPTRLDDYLKGCNRVQLFAGGAAVALSVPLWSSAAGHAAEALAADGLSTVFGAGHSAASQGFVAGLADLVGGYAIGTAC